MTSRKKGAKAPSGARAVRAPRSPWFAATWVLVAIGGVCALVWVWRTRDVVPAAARAADVGASAVDALDARTAYLEGAKRYAAGRSLEAVPYFRRVGVATPSAPREYHMQFAQVLILAAQQARTDVVQPATRSSVERVALMREAFRHLDVAQQLSRTPREGAEVHVTRANALRTWGFPWDGLAELRAAETADPSWRELAPAGDLVLRRLQQPERPIEGLESGVLEGPR